MKLTELEEALLVAAIRNEGGHSRTSLKPGSIEASERSMSGCGFMTTLCDTEATQLFAKGESQRLGDKTFAVVNGHEEVGVVVYVDDGKVTAIEGFTFGGEAWPETISEFQIEDPRNDPIPGRST